MEKILIIYLIFSAYSFGSVYCTITPDQVRIGGEGTHELDEMFLRSDEGWRSIGIVDERTKARLSIVLTAITTGKRISIKFSGDDECNSSNYLNDDNELLYLLMKD